MDDKKRKILITIAARGGSKGVKNKNIRPLCGLPLIAHTIKQAKKWGRADKIVCSTDSENIAIVAKEYGAEVPFVRPSDLANDTAGKVAVIRHALLEMKEDYDIIVDLDVTAPIRKISDIDGAVNLFLEKKAKTVFSVTSARRSPYFNMVEQAQSGFVHLVKKLKTPLVRRQDSPRVYDMNASIYVYDRDYLLDPTTKAAISDKSLIWEMDELSAFDIDCEADFKFVEFLVSQGMVKL